MTTEYKQFVYQLGGQWTTSCSCSYREESRTQEEANKKRDAHIQTHTETIIAWKADGEYIVVNNTTPSIPIIVDEHDRDVELSLARTEYFDAYSELSHTGAGAGDRIKRFHRAWELLNTVKRKFGFATVDATKPRVSR